MKTEIVKTKIRKPDKKHVYKIRPDGKNDVGRPAIFKSAEQLQKKIDEYFAGGYRKKKIKSNDIETEVPDITISDLVLFLGFSDRHSFYDCEKKKEFSHIIKRARTFIEREYESCLKGNNVAGAIFALKNFGWTDRTEIDISGKMVSHFSEQEKKYKELPAGS